MAKVSWKSFFGLFFLLNAISALAEPQLIWIGDWKSTDTNYPDILRIYHNPYSMMTMIVTYCDSTVYQATRQCKATVNSSVYSWDGGTLKNLEPNRVCDDSLPAPNDYSEHIPFFLRQKTCAGVATQIKYQALTEEP